MVKAGVGGVEGWGVRGGTEGGEGEGEGGGRDAHEGVVVAVFSTGEHQKYIPTLFTKHRESEVLQIDP